MAEVETELLAELENRKKKFRFYDLMTGCLREKSGRFLQRAGRPQAMIGELGDGGGTDFTKSCAA